MRKWALFNASKNVSFSHSIKELSEKCLITDMESIYNIGCEIGQDDNYCFTIIDESTDKPLGVSIGGSNIGMINNDETVTMTQELYSIILDSWKMTKQSEAMLKNQSPTKCPKVKVGSSNYDDEEDVVTNSNVDLLENELTE